MPMGISNCTIAAVMQSPVDAPSMAAFTKLAQILIMYIITVMMTAIVNAGLSESTEK